MSSSFIDSNAPRYPGPASELPRGLVVPPPEIRERITQEKAHHQPYFTDEYAKLILDDWTLAYYYEGMDVAYRSVEQGVEVVAIGAEEIGKFLGNTPEELRQGVKIKQP
jgi:hypothetical protein